MCQNECINHYESLIIIKQSNIPILSIIFMNSLCFHEQVCIKQGFVLLCLLFILNDRQVQGRLRAGDERSGSSYSFPTL